jgi:hypothetical protein
MRHLPAFNKFNLYYLKIIVLKGNYMRYFLSDKEKAVLFIFTVITLVLYFFYDTVYAYFSKKLQLVNMIEYYESMRDMDRSYNQIHAYLSNVAFFIYFVVLILFIIIGMLIYYRSLVRFFSQEKQIKTDIKIHYKLKLLNLFVILATMLFLLANGTLTIMYRLIIFAGVTVISILIIHLLSNKLTKKVIKRIKIYSKTGDLNQNERDNHVLKHNKFNKIYRITMLSLVSIMLVLSIFSIKQYRSNMKLPDLLYITNDTSLINVDIASIGKKSIYKISPIICTDYNSNIYCFNDWYDESEKRILEQYTLSAIEFELTQEQYQTYLDEDISLHVKYNGIEYKFSTEEMRFEKREGVWNLIIESKGTIPSSSYKELLITRNTLDLDVIYKDYKIILEKIEK